MFKPSVIKSCGKYWVFLIKYTDIADNSLVVKGREFDFECYIFYKIQMIMFMNYCIKSFQTISLLMLRCRSAVDVFHIKILQI